jgi:hypothetical protein
MEIEKRKKEQYLLLGHILEQPTMGCVRGISRTLASDN